MPFLTTYANAHDFLAATEADLLRNETINSLMLGICISLRTHPERVRTVPYLATVTGEQGLICAACMTPPHKLILYSQSNDHNAALRLLIEDLRAKQQTVPGVLALKQVALDFAQLWQEHTGQKYTIGIREQVFELTEVQHPTPVAGRMRLATEANLELVVRWLEAFMQEALHGDDPSSARAVANIKIQNRDVYLWELPDGEIVSMAAKTRPVLKVISIGPVYTPPEQRRKGYAANCVATLSQHLLDSGWQACSLFADLANPTSNSIYQKMGYRPLAEYHNYTFEG